jgi:hypothetical protein
VVRSPRVFARVVSPPSATLILLARACNKPGGHQDSTGTIDLTALDLLEIRPDGSTQCRGLPVPYDSCRRPRTSSPVQDPDRLPHLPRRKRGYVMTGCVPFRASCVWSHVRWAMERPMTKVGGGRRPAQNASHDSPPPGPPRMRALSRPRVSSPCLRLLAPDEVATAVSAHWRTSRDGHLVLHVAV